LSKVDAIACKPRSEFYPIPLPGFFPADFEHVQIFLDSRHLPPYHRIERVQNLALGGANMYIIACYATYLAISLTATVWVARTLHHNGRSFLVDAFHGNRELADSVNHLLVVGFYLINVGYVTLALHTPAEVTTTRSAIELVCDKIGVVLIVLGVMHFFNLYVFNRLRRRGQADFRPPFPPDARISMQPGL
jgi:hypothetical protein